MALGKRRLCGPTLGRPSAIASSLWSREDFDSYIRLLSPAAWFRADTGVTVTGLGVSTWADQSGNGRDLLQSTDASRPPYLSFSGTRYLYLPGASGNYASTPDVPTFPAGDICLLGKVNLVDWTPSADMTIIGKMGGAGSRSIRLYVLATTGVLTLQWSADGTTLISKSSTAAPTVSDGADLWVAATLDVDNGAAGNDVNFYTSSDGSSWTKLGNTVTTAGTTSIFDSNVALEVGGITSGTTSPLSGVVYRAKVLSGASTSASAIFDFNPSDASDASASFTSSATSEVWSINSSGGLPAQIVGRPSLLFDGTADYLKCNAFTLNQPETVYIAFKQVSWTSGDTIMDGEASRSLRVTQTPTTPSYAIDAGSVVGGDANLAVGSYGVLTAIFNGAASYTGINNVALAGPYNPGAANAGGFTLGAAGTPGGYANIQVLEVIIAAAAHDATQRARVMRGLMLRHRI